MKLLKFGLVGCGRIGERHAENINKIAELKSVCDIDEQKANKFGNQYSAKVFTEIDEMYKDTSLDVISICTPNGLHAIHSIKALRSGFHVLCEKPMAISVHDCGEMIKEAEMANKRLFIVKQNRYNPPVQVVKNILEQGKLGKVFNIQLNCFWNRNEEYYSQSDWKGTRQLDGGTLFTQFSDFIDLLYWFFGDVKVARSFTKNYIHNGIIEFEDTGVVILEFYSGMIGTINYTVNSFSKNMEGSLTIFGEMGTVKIGGQYLNELEYQNIKDFEIKNIPKGNPPNNYGK